MPVSSLGHGRFRCGLMKEGKKHAGSLSSSTHTCTRCTAPGRTMWTYYSPQIWYLCRRAFNFSIAVVTIRWGKHCRTRSPWTPSWWRQFLSLSSSIRTYTLCWTLVPDIEGFVCRRAFIKVEQLPWKGWKIPLLESNGMNNSKKLRMSDQLWSQTEWSNCGPTAHSCGNYPRPLHALSRSVHYLHFTGRNHGTV